jgi:hypothetical protein
LAERITAGRLLFGMETERTARAIEMTARPGTQQRQEMPRAGIASDGGVSVPSGASSIMDGCQNTGRHDQTIDDCRRPGSHNGRVKRIRILRGGEDGMTGITTL